MRCAVASTSPVSAPPYAVWPRTRCVSYQNCGSSGKRTGFMITPSRCGITSFSVAERCPRRVSRFPSPARLADCRTRSGPQPRSEPTLKAVRFSQFGGPEVLEIVDLPDPHPGPGQVRIAVRAAGVNASDWKKRQGLMDPELPQTLGYEAAGVVDELGEGVADVAVGDRVFGFSAEGAAQAELAVLSWYAPIPPSLDFAGAAALPAAVETATRALDQLGVGSGSTLLINGASGSVGSAAVQLAVVRGARVIGTASPV